MTALETLLADPEQGIAFVVRFDERNPDTDVVTTVNLQTANRNGTEGYPSLLLDPGGRSDKLEADELVAIAQQLVAPVTLKNEPTAPGVDGPLDYLRHRSLAGRDITILAGHPSEPIANYEPVATGGMDREPAFDGGVVEIRVKSPLERLNVDLDVGTYVGEPGALRLLTTTGRAAAADNSAHHLAEFTLAGRFKVSTLRAIFVNEVTARYSSGTAMNWQCGPLGTGGSTGSFHARYSVGGVASAVALTGTSLVDDGEWHAFVFARRSGHAYLMIDGVIEAETSTPGSPDQPTAGVTVGRNFGNPGGLCDSRIVNRYHAPREMRSAMAVRADGGEPGLVGLWRGDDNTDSTLTDYSPTGAHATISGTEGVDFVWVSSDLGTAELAGRSMAAFWGEPWNMPADLVDPFRERWRIAGPSVMPAGFTHVLRVRDEGEALASGVDFSWTSGDTTLALTAEAGEPVTVGVARTTGSGTWLSEALGDILEMHPLIASSDYITRRLNALFDRVKPAIWTRRRTLREVVAEVVSGCLGFVATSMDGVFRFDALVSPTSPSPRDGACLEIVSGTPSPDFSSILWETGGAVVSSRDFSMAAWIKTHRVGHGDGFTPGTIPVVYLKGSSDDAALTIGFAGEEAQLRIGGSGLGDGVIIPNFTASTWWFVAAVHDHTGGAVRLYAGREGGSLALLGGVSPLSLGASPDMDDVRVGKSPSGAFAAMYGSTFEPQVWDSLLTLAGLQALMDAAPVGNEVGLAFYAPLDGESTVSLTDAVSSVAGTVAGDVREVPDLVLDLRTDPKVYRSRQQRPAREIEVAYRHNFAVLDPSNITATVSQEDALDLQTEARFERWSDPEVEADYLDARSVSVPALWSTARGAQAALRIARHRFAPGREQSDLIDAGRQAILLRLGDEVRVYGKRWDLATGPVFRVAANNVRLGALTCDLGLWR